MKSLFFLLFSFGFFACNKSSDSGGGGSDKTCNQRNQDECNAAGAARCTFTNGQCFDAGAAPSTSPYAGGGGLGTNAVCSNRQASTCASDGYCSLVNGVCTSITGTSNCSQFNTVQAQCQATAGCQWQGYGNCLSTNALGGSTMCAGLAVSQCRTSTSCCVNTANACQAIGTTTYQCTNTPYTPGVGPGGTYPNGSGGWYNPGGGGGSNAPQGPSIGNLILLGGGLGALSGVSGGLGGMFQGFLNGATGVLGGAVNNGLYSGNNGSNYNPNANPNNLNSNINGACSNQPYASCINLAAQYHCVWDQATNLCHL